MSPRNGLRQYEHIWLAIKKLDEVSVSVEPRMKDRVVKAVVKEKNIDLGFKLLNTDFANFRLYHHYDPPTRILTFKLVDHLGLVGKKEA